MTKFESCVYKGDVVHKRTEPKLHKFNYQIYLWFIKLNELESLSTNLKAFHCASSGLNTFRFNQNDYVKDESGDLTARVLKKMNKLSSSVLSGDVFFFGQLRTFGMYFSPVNFYFLRDVTGLYTHMLAEVSNTPWNERHFYLVDLNKQSDCKKAFHVSPFNPMDMIYKWKVTQPSENFNLQLSCYRNNKHFEAALNMKKQELSNNLLSKLRVQIPSMTLKTLAGIYWQALKLFIKRVPIYSHPVAQKQKGTNDVAQ